MSTEDERIKFGRIIQELYDEKLLKKNMNKDERRPDAHYLVGPARTLRWGEKIDPQDISEAVEVVQVGDEVRFKGRGSDLSFQRLSRGTGYSAGGKGFEYDGQPLTSEQAWILVHLYMSDID